jgi:hypothetical protein
MATSWRAQVTEASLARISNGDMAQRYALSVRLSHTITVVGAVNRLPTPW